MKKNVVRELYFLICFSFFLFFINPFTGLEQRKKQSQPCQPARQLSIPGIQAGGTRQAAMTREPGRRSARPEPERVITP